MGAGPYSCMLQYQLMLCAGMLSHVCKIQGRKGGVCVFVSMSSVCSTPVSSLQPAADLRRHRLSLLHSIPDVLMHMYSTYIQLAASYCRYALYII